MVACW